MRDDLEMLVGHRIKTCREHAPGYLVEAYTEEGVKVLVLPYNLEVLLGRMGRVSRHEDAMNAPAIFDYISNKLHNRLR